MNETNLTTSTLGKKIKTQIEAAERYARQAHSRQRANARNGF